MPRARWFFVLFLFAIIVGMISGAPVQPDVPSAIAGESHSTTVGTPSGDELTIFYAIPTTALDE